MTKKKGGIARTVRTPENIKRVPGDIKKSTPMGLTSRCTSCNEWPIGEKDSPSESSFSPIQNSDRAILVDIDR